jgi:hypothetical protein
MQLHMRRGHQIAGVILAAAVACAPLSARAAAQATDTTSAHASTIDAPPQQEPVESIFEDLPPPSEPHKKLSLGIAAGIYGALYGYTYLAWYARTEDSPTLHFHDEGFFGMDTYAGGADKLGHMWGNYAMVRGVSRILEWGGWSKTMSLTSAAGMTLGFFMLSEIKDGYKPQYGFSWGDVGFNVAGEALAVLMEASPTVDRMFDFKVAYFPSKAFRDSVSEEGPFNSPEDYTGQRFLLAYHLSTIDTLRESQYFGWTSYMDVAIGFDALHFKPEAADPNDHKQDLFVGVSLNVQQIIDRTLMPSPRSHAEVGTGPRALRFAAEIIQVPYTTFRLGGFSRTAPDDPVPAATTQTVSTGF